MQELPHNKWSIARDLVGEHQPFVTISMLMQRCIGTIWVDEFSNPTTLIASFPKDAYASGRLSTPEAQAILRLLYGSLPETPGLRDALQEAWGTFSITRAILHSLAGLSNPPPEVPRGYRVEVISEENIKQVVEFWQAEHDPGTIGDFLDLRDFLHSGFGACVIEEESGQCVSACAAISVSALRADFGLDTSPLHEGKGLATACAYQAVREALKRKKQPVWVTDCLNHASQKVAAKLGFVKSYEFEIYKRVSIL